MKGARSDPPPHGFENCFEKNHSNRIITFIRCTKTAFDPLTKKMAQCKYKIRKDNFKGKHHKCVFSDLDSFIIRKERTINGSLNEMDEYIFHLAGKKNIPMNTIVSDEFFQMLKAFFIKGQSSQGKDFETIFPKQSRPTFTKKFIVHSEHLKLIALKNYCGFACLAIDGGKVGPNSILNCIVLNPLKNGLRPLLYEGIYNFIGNCDSYIKEISRIILELQDIGIKITGIVTDNLKAQVMATDHNSERSLQQNSKIYNNKISNSYPMPMSCCIPSNQ